MNVKHELKNMLKEVVLTPCDVTSRHLSGKGLRKIKIHLRWPVS